MSRTQNSFEYKEYHEELIEKLVTETPKTTNAITLGAKEIYFKKIHNFTVNRLLNNLYDKGRIKKFSVGRIILWQK